MRDEIDRCRVPNFPSFDRFFCFFFSKVEREEVRHSGLGQAVEEEESAWMRRGEDGD